MVGINRGALFGKLSPLAYRAIDSATTFCKLRGNPHVELVHWIHQLLTQQDSDLQRILDAFAVDAGRLVADLTERLDALPRGATSVLNFSPHLEETVERGWVVASLMFGDATVRSGYLVIGLLQTRGLASLLGGLSRELEKITLERLVQDYAAICAGSPEDNAGPAQALTAGAEPGEMAGALAPGARTGDALTQYTVDWTERARSGNQDPIVGRDAEIRQLIDILLRRRQNNPILTGEAGVGKTALVEGFAQRIAAGDVPPALRDVSLRELDVAQLQAGASMKGEFENRLKAVIEAVQGAAQPIILFIDEAHTLIGAGGAAGTGDAANLLKPALARGTLRTIAATTLAEYRRHIEKDPALTRRFQVVSVPEPAEAQAIQMMRAIASMLEQHHQVQILDEAIEASVRMSSRYIPARQLPDKSTSLLDTACARVAISQHAVPAELEDCRRRIESLTTELQIIDREALLGIDTAARRATAVAARTEADAQRAALETRWAAEQALVQEILALRKALRCAGANPDASAEAAPSIDRLRELQTELSELQGEQPLILPSVDAQAVATVVSDWTGVPVGRMVSDELTTILALPTVLSQRIIGQDHALEMIARRVRTSRAGLDNPSKPIGVFMLAGTSGVGKTETALALAEALYGGEQNLITINMSEFQEAHTVSSLKGAPPGYVGYGEGGVLTEAVRRRPYSVVLLDEIEKAHSDVHELFFQVFDKGVMEDGEGRQIDFRNTLILLTTNVGTELISRVCADSERLPAPDTIATALRDPLLEVFPAALLGRLVVVPYFPLSDQMLEAITRLQLERVRQRVEATYNVPFSYDDAVVQLITSRCTEVESGGRMIDSILTNTLLPAISAELLERLLAGTKVTRVALGSADTEFTYAFD